MGVCCVCLHIQLMSKGVYVCMGGAHVFASVYAWERVCICVRGSSYECIMGVYNLQAPYQSPSRLRVCLGVCAVFHMWDVCDACVVYYKCDVFHTCDVCDVCDVYEAATECMCCKVLQCVAVCCNVLQYVEVCCSVLQHGATHERLQKSEFQKQTNKHRKTNQSQDAPDFTRCFKIYIRVSF